MSVRIIIGDAREKLAELPSESVHCVVTSPPYYGLRDYGVAGQIGLEPSPDEYITMLVGVFREVRRVMREDATLWLNLGDYYAGSWSGNSLRPDGGAQREGGPGFQPLKDGRYAPRSGGTYGLKAKDLLMIPARVALALQADGWWLRSDIIWHKPNPMPESVTDRPTSAHEHMFLLAKSERYHFDAAAVAEKMASEPRARDRNGEGYGVALGTGRPRFCNIRNVWTIAIQPYSEAHFATFPPALIEPCIKAGCPLGGTVLDPFGGAGTTGLVADRLGRHAILIELNPQYAEMARRRIEHDAGMFARVCA